MYTYAHIHINMYKYVYAYVSFLLLHIIYNTYLYLWRIFHSFQKINFLNIFKEFSKKCLLLYRNWHFWNFFWKNIQKVKKWKFFQKISEMSFLKFLSKIFRNVNFDIIVSTFFNFFQKSSKMLKIEIFIKLKNIYK